MLLFFFYFPFLVVKLLVKFLSSDLEYILILNEFIKKLKYINDI